MPAGESPSPTYRLRTFGTLGVEPAHPALAQRKRLALLALLAHGGVAGLSRDRMLAYLWPESDEERARNALHQLAFSIRREFGEDAIQSVGPDFRIGRHRLASDVAEFRDALETGELERAAEIYSGPFLHGFHLREAPEFERWCDDARRELQASYHDVLERLARRANDAGAASDIVKWTRLRAASEPVSTLAALAYMQALVTAGDRTAALKHAQLHVAVVRTQLDAEPGADFERYVAALRDGTSEPKPSPRAASSANAASSPRAASSPHQAASLSASLRSTRVTASPPDSRAVEHVAPVAPRAPPTQSRWRRPIPLVAVLSMLSLAVTVALLPPSPLTLGASTALTSGQSVELDPALSPDGKFVAFAAGRPGEKATLSSSTRIYVKQVGGERAVALTSDSSGAQRSPRWSPDGTRIAYETRLGIFVVPAFGGAAERLVSDSGHALFVGGWSPDGKQLALSDDRGVWVLDIASGTKRHVTSAGFRPHSVAWSPDGSLLAFVVGTGTAVNIAPSSIWLVSSSGGKAQRISDLTHLNTSPVFAPDGRSILFVSNQDGTRDVYQQALRRARARGRATRLTTGTNAISVSLSADGKRLAYGALMLRSNIWTAPISLDATATAADATPLTSGNQEIECVAVSPDARWLIYDSNVNGTQDIYKMPAQGGEAVRLTNDPADDFCGRMSPDGREIVFYTFRDGGRRRVYTMRADGSAQAPVTDSIGQQRSPSWDATGSRIKFLSDRAGRYEYYVVSRTAHGWSAPRLLGAPLGTDARASSANGKYLAISTDSGIALVPTDTVAKPYWLARPAPPVPWRQGWADAAYITWGARQSVLYYRTSTSSPAEFWAVDATGGAPRLVLRFDDPAHPSRRIEFASDGSRIYFTVASDEATAFMVELRR